MINWVQEVWGGDKGYRDADAGLYVGKSKNGYYGIWIRGEDGWQHAGSGFASPEAAKRAAEKAYEGVMAA
jgi:hypothetical protein